jgi:glycosyltransferase involved in cell wall biosynthesis
MADGESFDRERLRALMKAAPGFVKRQAKTAGQLRFAWLGKRRVGFVFGCQRSGTKMVMWVLEKHPKIRIFQENHASAFHDFQLRPDPVIRALIATSPAPIQVFKPICDSHEADRILDRFPESRAVWIWRDADDVANSAVKKWADHQREVVDAVAAGDLETWGWRTARLPADVVADIQRVHRPDLTAHEGALLFWYLRNQFFFALGLDRHPRMRLVHYRPLVETPREAFPALLEQLGAEFDPAIVAEVHSSSVGKSNPPAASAEIRALVDALQARLEAWAPAEAGPPTLPRTVLLMIDTLNIGGAERYAVTVANWMAEQGIRVALVSEGGDLEPDLDPRVELFRAPVAQIRAPGLPAAATRVREVIAETSPDVIITNSLATAIIARSAQPRGRTKVVNVAHGWPADRYSRIAPLMRVADRVVAVSPDVRDKLVVGGCDAERIAVVFNGVDCRGREPRTGEVRAKARAAMGGGEGDVIVATVGRLEDQKAHQHIMAVAAKLAGRHPRVRFALIGGGSREPELRDLAAAPAVDGRVTLLGLRTDIPDLLGSADLFFNCSDWEGMPLTTIEAMAASLPVVATATEGASQLLDETCGIIVPVGDPDAMAEAISGLVSDDARRLAMGAAAKARAWDGFSHERMARELVENAAVAMQD